MILTDTQKEEFTKLKDIRIFEKLDNEQRDGYDSLSSRPAIIVISFCLSMSFIFSVPT